MGGKENCLTVQGITDLNLAEFQSVSWTEITEGLGVECVVQLEYVRWIVSIKPHSYD